MGRPSIYTDELAETICSRMAEGESILQICRDDDMPDNATIYRWLPTKPGFCDKYMRAREVQADRYGHEVIETPLPAVITVVKEINVPRLPSLRGITRSKRIEIPAWTAEDLEVDEGRVGLAGSATWVVEIFFPQRVHQGEMLEGDPEGQADALIEKLRELKIA